MKLLILAAAAAMLSPGAADAQTAAGPVAAPEGQRWSEVVTKTDAGGYLMGNPDAPVKVVEYASLTCGHCAHFAMEGEAPLKADYVDTGRVSFELRNYTLNVVDVAATLVARCGSESDFFPMVEVMYADQQGWFQSMIPQFQALLGAIDALPIAEQLPRIAEVGRLKGYAAARGIDGARVDACLADPAALEELRLLRASAERDYQVRGTPTFVVNHVRATDYNQWDGLKPALDRALAAK